MATLGRFPTIHLSKIIPKSGVLDSGLFCYDCGVTIQQIHRLREKQPFEPFRIVTADGSRYDVRHPENLALTGNGRIIVVAMRDYAATLDLLLVTGIEQPIPHKKNGAGRKGS
jgi:hypothetical protein